MLPHSGKLLIRVHRPGWLAWWPTWFLREPGFTKRTLFRYRAQDSVSGGLWFEAAPQRPAGDEHPWDMAHRVAAAHGYRHFVEPDLLHQGPARAAAGPSAKPSGPAPPPVNGMNPDWPPRDPVSPAWHLDSAHTGFLDVRKSATGKGIRVAHLDTGYWPEHISTPRGIRPDLGYNFYENNTDTVDPGVQGLLDNPGHGTATVAILAGAAVNLDYRGQTYQGDLGGAPDSEVVPVRIGPSVVHFFTSTMADGLAYALAPRDNKSLRCDVLTTSMGGVPSQCWADAVNELYSAGVVAVGASGDNYYLVVDFPTHAAVYPSAFNRVITATGATYDQAPYTTTKFGELQGNWGPDAVMQKAAAGYAPNLPWMKFQTRDQYDMNGQGTSVAAPQIAAACALWLERYGTHYEAGWQRVEACRLALLESARRSNDAAEIGQGTLNVPAMLSDQLEAGIRAKLQAGQIHPMPADVVEEPFWRLIFDLPPADSPKEGMYDLEMAQVVHRTRQPALARGKRDHANRMALAPAQKPEFRKLIRAEPDLSQALQARLKLLP